MKGKRVKTIRGSASSTSSITTSTKSSSTSIFGRIREVERGVVDGQDLNYINGLTELLGHVHSLFIQEDASVADEEEEEGKKFKANRMKEAKEGREAAILSMHALRRIFLVLVKRGDVCKPLATSCTTANGKKNETKGNKSNSSSRSIGIGRKRARDTDTSNIDGRDGVKGDALDEFNRWIYGQYQSFLSLLLHLVDPSSPVSPGPSFSSSSTTRTRAAALRTIMELVKVESIVRRKPFRCFGHDLFYRLIARLVSSSSSSSSSKGAANKAKKEKQAQAQGQAELMEVLRVDYILPYSDVRYWLLKSLRVLAGREGGREEGKEGQEARTAAMLKMLMLVTVEKNEADMVSFWVSFAGEEGDGALVPKAQDGRDGGREDGEEEDEEGFDFMGEGFGDDDWDEGEDGEEEEVAAPTTEKVPHAARLSEHRKALGEAWVACLRLPSFTPSLYRVTTQFVARHVLEKMPNPLQLADFFTVSYAQGGLTALVALEGLFVLMQAHNLEYPRFYSSLYRLLAPGPQLLYSRHRSRFFKLLRFCLVSPAVPAHVVAAFLKRLFRLALLAPPPSIIFLLSLLVLVLRAHPACLALLHRAFNFDKASVMHLDTFNPHAQDPATAFHQEEEEEEEQQQQQQQTKTKKSQNEKQGSMSTIQTSLWEVAGLQSHYHPSVAMLAKGLEVSTPEDPKTLNPVVTDMDELASYAYTDLFLHEGKQRRKMGKDQEGEGGRRGGGRRGGGKEEGGEGGVALTFEKMARPDKLFQPGDVFDGLFALPSVAALE